MLSEKLRNRLSELHEQENEMNKEMNKISKQIFELGKKKQKLTRRISQNMKYRNQLIQKKWLGGEYKEPIMAADVLAFRWWKNLGESKRLELLIKHKGKTIQEIYNIEDQQVKEEGNPDAQ